MTWSFPVHTAVFLSYINESVKRVGAPAVWGPWGFPARLALLAPSTPGTLWLIPCNRHWRWDAWLEQGGLSEETGESEGPVTMAIPAWSPGDIHQDDLILRANLQSPAQPPLDQDPKPSCLKKVNACLPVHLGSLSVCWPSWGKHVLWVPTLGDKGTVLRWKEWGPRVPVTQGEGC